MANASITITVKKSTKTYKIRMKFDKDVHTIFDIKKAYCDEQSGSKDPSKMVLRKTGNALKDNLKLTDCNIKKNTTLYYRFKVKGGAAVKQRPNYSTIYNNKRKRKLNKADPDIRISKKTNCICACTGNQLAEMPCGHAFCSEFMWNLIKMVFTKNEYSVDIICPISGCGRKWDFDLCCKVADMTDGEYEFFCDEIEIRTAPECQECPYCEEDCERPENLTMYRINCEACTGGDWCWICSGKWIGSGFTVCGNKDCGTALINVELANCREKETTYTDSNGKYVVVPLLRACPKCLELIEHEDACKHMTCYDCGHEFCFSCLKGKKDGNWQCGTHRNQCVVAPRQKF